MHVAHILAYYEHRREHQLAVLYAHLVAYGVTRHAGRPLRRIRSARA